MNREGIEEARAGPLTGNLFDAANNKGKSGR